MSVTVNIQPICLPTAEMAKVLGFSERWLESKRKLLKANGAQVHDGRWHVASTEAAWLECCHKGLLGKVED